MYIYTIHHFSSLAIQYLLVSALLQFLCSSTCSTLLRLGKDCCENDFKHKTENMIHPHNLNQRASQCALYAHS